MEHCIVKDDLQPVIIKAMESDLLLIGTPCPNAGLPTLFPAFADVKDVCVGVYAVQGQNEKFTLAPFFVKE